MPKQKPRKYSPGRRDVCVHGPVTLKCLKLNNRNGGVSEPETQRQSCTSKIRWQVLEKWSTIKQNPLDISWKNDQLWVVEDLNEQAVCLCNILQVLKRTSVSVCFRGISRLPSKDWGCVILREIDFLLKFADRFLAYTHRGKYILEFCRYVGSWQVRKKEKLYVRKEWFHENKQFRA